MNKAIFLDRDGVINKRAPEHVFITCPDEFEFISGALSAIKKLGSSEYKVIIVTNQRGISSKKMNEEDLKNIHEKMLSNIVSFGGHVDHVYYCPHGHNECNCRKPLPGMINLAKKKFDIDLQESWMIGDSESDILLGKAAGCRTFFIGKKNYYGADFFAKNLFDAVETILG